ncbi:MAG: amidohydrolase family protein [Verrucomicrobia bacterium]|nr:amidohydrolase family protein [Verrucomicrobiota bacterium]
MSIARRIRSVVLILASLSWLPVLILPAQEPAKTDPSKAEKILLKDFRPVSRYKIPRTKVPKARYPAIDVHGHDYAKTEEEVARWVETMDKVGIEKMIVMTQSTGPRFDQIAAKYKKYPERFQLWCGLNLTDHDQPGFGQAAAAELERCYRAGARGVGEISDKGLGVINQDPKAPGLHLDDPRLAPLFEKCADLHIPINLHVGEPIWFYLPMDEKNDGLMNAYHWRLDNKTNLLSHAEIIQVLENVLKRHPRTTIIACHYANCEYDFSILARLLDTYPNLYSDISGRYEETAPIPRTTSNFITKYQDRLLYGTDMGRGQGAYEFSFHILETLDEAFYENGYRYHWQYYGFGLEDAILKKLYQTNALKILAK